MSGPQALSRPLAARVASLGASAEMLNTAPEVSEAVIAAAVDALARGETHYTDRAGVPLLRSLVADQLNAAYGLTLNPKVVTITCGVAEARFVALRILAKPGTAIVCPGDSAAINGIAQLIGANVIQQQSTNDSASVYYLTPADDPAWIETARHGTSYIIWDMSDCQVNLPPAHPAQHSDLAPRVTTLGGLEDALPGWRVGWLAGSDMADKLRSFKQTLTICTTNVSQWAAAAWFKA